MAESQDIFPYSQDMNDILACNLSLPRLAPYMRLQSVGGNTTLALKWYLWNARLSKSFLFPLQAAEVVVRNAIHNAFSNFFGGSNWVFRPPFSFTPQTASSHTASLNRLTSNKINPTADDLIASLSFDFWSNLFREEYEALWMSPGLISEIFPNSPPGTDRQKIQKTVKKINILRNRIAHHEPIHQENHRNFLEKIEEIVGYVSVEASSWLKMHSTVLEVVRSQPTAESEFNGRPLVSANIRPPLILDNDHPLNDAIKKIGALRPQVALVNSNDCDPPYKLITLADTAVFICETAISQGNIIDLSEYKIEDVFKVSVHIDISTISKKATTGDAVSLFFPKGREKSKPQALIVTDPDTNNEIVGLIIKPSIRF